MVYRPAKITFGENLVLYSTCHLEFEVRSTRAWPCEEWDLSDWNTIGYSQNYNFKWTTGIHFSNAMWEYSMNAFWPTPTMSLIYLLYLICVAVHVFLPEITLAHRCNDKKWSSEILMVTILFDQHLGEVVYVPQLNLSYFEVGWRISESWHREGKHTYKPREVDMLILNTPCIIPFSQKIFVGFEWPN